MYFTLNVHVEVEVRRGQPLGRHAGTSVLVDRSLNAAQRAEKLEVVTESTQGALETLLAANVLKLDWAGTEVHALHIEVVDIEGGLLTPRPND
ncbi:MAG: hypothetical protein B5766_07325 [Candidatus Lumbricidophila eiseniae]|uniref:Uncharacterized protein n=1 Tax=Candidatus Lumbricidiphila eiseniae TaxID=1969409 RepID=A0A2A6FQH6_9MICO|nr:MAG: hypothetical protein B5766_07325 [Candidatus Lumbricidophila eiseniae]